MKISFYNTQQRDFFFIFVVAVVIEQRTWKKNKMFLMDGILII